jgi:maleate cis-trans isomerase
MYGFRARVGYTSPPRLTEIFCRDFYRVMPEGVSLVITTLVIREMSEEELQQSLQMARAAALDMAGAGVDVVVLGGVPINLTAAGPAGVATLIQETGQVCGVPVTSSLSAQMNALHALGARRVAVVQPFAEAHSGSYNYLDYFGFERVGTTAAGFRAIELGRVGEEVSAQLGRQLLAEHPEADSLYFPCPHWPVVDNINRLEQELGINVVSAGQAIFWEALRLSGIDDRISGYGRLLQEH